MLERLSRDKGRFVTKKPPFGGGTIPPKTLLAFAFPAGFGCSFGDTAPLLRAEGFRSCLATLKSTHASERDSGGVLTAFTGLARSDGHDIGGQTIGV
jgi:hypothetical protein